MNKARPLQGMLVKRQQALIGQDRWQVSYADFMTLLLGFFIVMYSIQALESDQRAETIEALQKSFSNNHFSDLAVKSFDELSQGENTLTGNDLHFPFFLDNQQFIEKSGDWLHFSIASEAFFESGDATLIEASKAELKKLVSWLISVPSTIEIEGHTDNRPIQTALFPNNWALSSARAVAIVDYLQSEGIAGHRLRAVGLGHFSPIADNSTELGQQRNRRVVIKVEQGNLPLPLMPLLDNKASKAQQADTTAKNQSAFDKQEQGKSQSIEQIAKSINDDNDFSKAVERLESKGIHAERQSSGGLKFSHDP